MNGNVNLTSASRHVKDEDVHSPERYLPLFRTIHSHLWRTLVMYIETRSLSSVVSLLHEDQVSDCRCGQHPHNSEP